jgi:hypothetical protein
MILLWTCIGIIIGVTFGLVCSTDSVDDDGFCPTCGHWEDEFDCDDEEE